MSSAPAASPADAAAQRRPPRRPLTNTTPRADGVYLRGQHPPLPGKPYRRGGELQMDATTQPVRVLRRMLHRTLHRHDRRRSTFRPVRDQALRIPHWMPMP
ncbi:hypothetical protein [Microbacterium elymi]|uniref:Uncharacterized protein n=1 Tax=Microbacterium elymi TaxID=2909587 RepID=A0ABY5NLP4_9MICO|nr:hypothetical protein [Microbacterium elymi]UUT36111.1 hypothetical protein L2X98_23865 [Microbacterium elymi]